MHRHSLDHPARSASTDARDEENPCGATPFWARHRPVAKTRWSSWVWTHNDVHVAAVISVLGVLLGTRAFPTTAAGYTALLDWARGHGRLRRAGVEGTSSHGTALTRHLRHQGVQVLEVNRPDRATRRRRGKTDTVDA
jgi:Transposase